MYRTHLNKVRVKFFTRSFSLELFEQSRHLYEEAGFPCVRLTDQSADGYFYTMLEDEDCDLAINVDEDAFIEDLEAVLDLAEYVLENGYANAGCPDTSPGCPRSGNPLVTNPFFNIFDLKQIRGKWQGRATLKSFDCKGKAEYEPYYKFFYWLAENFQTLYLPNEKHADGFSTVLFSIDGRCLCKHSWMSRFYHQRPKETRRINALIDEVCAARGTTRLVFSRAQILSFRIDYAKRFLIRIPQRISRWPQKWRRWLGR